MHVNAEQLQRILKNSQRVAEAVNNKGVAPHYHRQQLLRLKQEWPVLYEAVQALAADYASTPQP